MGVSSRLLLIVGYCLAGPAARAAAALPVQAAALDVTVVGNAGVVLSDGASSLLVDLPYESGAFGYMTYDPVALDPPGTVTSIITHDHADHFDPELFRRREGWRIFGPPSVTEGLPTGRVVEGDSVSLGAFDVVVIPAPHTADHRSYRRRIAVHLDPRGTDCVCGDVEILPQGASFEIEPARQ